MLASGSGSIIHVSSMNGSVPFPQRLAYCVSKAGLNMMTKVMAIEWEARGVWVNAIAPGYVQTEFITMLSARGILDAEKLARRTPMGRIGTPEEIGEVAVFLAPPPHLTSQARSSPSTEDGLPTATSDRLAGGA